MAEYYPLLSRAVAGLRDGAPEARQAIYGRARQALLGQLRGMRPAVPEEAITKEITALDEAIGKIEAEIVPPPSVSDAASAAVEAALLLDAAPPPAAASERPEVAAVSPIPVAAVAPPPAAVTLRPPVNRIAAPPARASLPAEIRPERATFAPRQTLPGLRPARPETAAAASATLAASPDTTVDSSALPVAPTLESVLVKRDAVGFPAMAPTPDVKAPDPGALDGSTIGAPALEVRGRDEASRPAMPRQVAPRPRDLRVWIVALASLAAVVVIAATAWKLRDNPAELSRVATPAHQPDTTPGKIVERADSTVVAEEDTPDAAPVVAAQGPSPSVQGTPGPRAVTPEPSGGEGAAAQQASDQTVPVAYKAAVLVAAPDTPEKVKTFVGTVVWRSQGSMRDLANMAVRADIDVPDAKLQMTMEIRKNTEAQFPASHTIDIKFTPGLGGSIGAVKQIDVPQMRREDAPTGEPLSGVPVAITSNSFLVGLTRGDAEARNVEAMRSRGWFDIPMVLEDGKPAKITFEKGASGDRILADALAAWGRT